MIIYSGATILRNVTIGTGSIIGGNVWLVHDVPPGSRVYLEDAPEKQEIRSGLVHVTESVDYLLEMKIYFENFSTPTMRHDFVLGCDSG